MQVFLRTGRFSSLREGTFTSQRKMARTLANCSARTDRSGSQTFLQTATMWFSRFGSSPASSIVVSNLDGSGRHAIVDLSERRLVCCAQWTPDGRYIVFQDQNRGRLDLWAAQVQAGFLQRVHPPVKLTDGPLSYRGPVPSRDGKQIFALGMKERGELVRYDVNSKQFVPFLSAFRPLIPPSPVTESGSPILLTPTARCGAAAATEQIGCNLHIPRYMCTTRSFPRMGGGSRIATAWVRSM